MWFNINGTLVKWMHLKPVQKPFQTLGWYTLYQTFYSIPCKDCEHVHISLLSVRYSLKEQWKEKKKQYFRKPFISQIASSVFSYFAEARWISSGGIFSWPCSMRTCFVSAFMLPPEKGSKPSWILVFWEKFNISNQLNDKKMLPRLTLTVISSLSRNK